MRFCGRETVAAAFKDHTVAIVGSGPGVLDNAPGFVDSHDVVLRVNNYKLTVQTGERTDVFYSFFGRSIRKTRDDLEADGVRLCMCKCPDAKFMESKWHRIKKKPRGVDFRYIYLERADWWFCDTFVPSVEDFMETFTLLGKHVPTTGFAAIHEVLKHDPRSVYITGFDFFSSGIHNLNEKWRAGDPSDPIGHAPQAELKWLAENMNRHPIAVDSALAAILTETEH